MNSEGQGAGDGFSLQAAGAKTEARGSSRCVGQEVGHWYNIAECTVLGQEEER